MTAKFLARILIGFLLSGISQIVSADPPASGTEPAAGFSYTIPSGWHLENWSTSKYAVSCPPPEVGYRPNLFVIDKTNTKSFAEHAKDAIAALPKLWPTSLKILNQSEFVTATGSKGIRLMFTSSLQGHAMRTLAYLLPGKGGKKYLVLFSSLEDDHDKYDAAVDGAVRSFKLL